MTVDRDTDRQKLIDFADKHLQPYKLHNKVNGDIEIIPDFCPFCHGNGHDKGTFALNVTHGVFNCRRGSCGKVGTFRQLAEFFNDDTKITSWHSDDGVSREKSYTNPEVNLQPPTSEIYQYFERRKITKETVDSLGVKSDDSGHIVFPFYENGDLVYVKYRKPHKPQAGEPKEWAAPNAKPILWNMDNIVFSQDLYITEGMIDAMSLYQSGITNVVSVPSGCSDTRWIGLCWDWLQKFKNIVIAGDGDEPGRKMANEVSQRLGASRCKIVEEFPTRPDGITPVKDANECLYWYGEAGVLDLVLYAKEVPVRGLLDLADVPDTDPTVAERISTRIPSLDQAFGGLRMGAVSIWTGKAGAGKSTCAGLFLLGAIEQGFSVCAYSGELMAEEFKEWLGFQAAGSDYITLKYDPIVKEEVAYVPMIVRERLNDYYRGRFFLFDNNESYEGTRTQAIISIFEAAWRKHGCRLFLVDNVLTSLADSGTNEYEAQAMFINELVSFAKRTRTHVMVVAHPRKTKKDDALTQEDVGGNSALINLAYCAAAIEQPAMIRILKNRGTGKKRIIECCYEPDSRRLYENLVGDLNVFSWDKTGIKIDRKAKSLPCYSTELPKGPTATPF